MRILLLRHGQTDWNAQCKLQGQVDIPLNRTGIAQAAKVKSDLEEYNIDITFVSPLNRAIATEEIIKGDKNWKTLIEPRLIERSFGIYEGTDYNSLGALNLRDWKANIPIPGGESCMQVYERILSFLEHLQAEYPDKTVMLVTHSNVARCIYWYFKGFPIDNSPPYKTPHCQIIEYSC